MLQPLELKLGEGFTDDDNRTAYKERTEANNCQRSREASKYRLGEADDD
jgi:hypothetical protein